MSGRGGHGCGRVRFIHIGGGRWRNFNSSNNRNKRQELKFYLHGTILDRYTEIFTKVKEHLILKIQSKFVNGNDILESIRKGYILYLSKETPIKIYLQKMNQEGPNRKMSPSKQWGI